MKQQQLLEIIKEELILKNQQVHIDKVIPLVKTDFVYQVIDKNLPIYEDQLKQILFEQSKESIGKVICDLEYKQKIREMQDELEKQILTKKTARQKEKQTQNFKKLKPKLEVPQIQTQPPNQVQLLQQNLTQLVVNFTTLIAAQINNPIQKQKHKKSHKSKRDDQVDKQELQNTIKLNKQGTQNTQQQSPEKQSTQKNFQNISSSSSNSLNNQPAQPQNYQKTNQQPVNKREQYKPSPQQSHQSANDENDEFQDFNDNSYQPSSFVDRNRLSRQNIQQNIRPQTPQFELTPQKDDDDLYNSDYIDEIQDSKGPIKKQIENFSSVSQEYPDDFIEESQQQLSQVQSNFFKKKAEQSKAVEQFDYDDDIEDLLI